MVLLFDSLSPTRLSVLALYAAYALAAQGWIGTDMLADLSAMSGGINQEQSRGDGGYHEGESEG